MIDFKKRVFWRFTFKDILTIISPVAIPIALAIYTAVGYQQQKQQAEKKQKFDLEQSRELRQQTLYDEFLNNIYKLDKDGYLNDTKNPWAFANAYYRAAHRQWDTIRKADVLQFLKEKQLIGRNNCSNECKTTKLDDIIRLNELNFDNVHLASETGILNKLNLQCVSFDQISMSNGEFVSVNLNGVSFDGGRLNNVKFDGSSLLCASFNRVNLVECNYIINDNKKPITQTKTTTTTSSSLSPTTSPTTTPSSTSTSTTILTATSTLTSTSTPTSTTTTTTSTTTLTITSTTSTTTTTTTTSNTTVSSTIKSTTSTITRTTTITATTTATSTITTSTSTVTTTTTVVPNCSPSVCCSAVSCTTCVYSSTTYYCLLYSNPPGYNLYTSASSCASDGGADIYCNYNTTCGIGAGTPGLGSGNGCK
ncbi:unnamed protein product [Adineta steineri]|uniref:Uncharacterized protein n=1 Tax=Adineta steineri TaxID=433720 RepID=A0A814VUU2_9BILA|nr:unnamed protein product [Adineta steineri]CAF1452973.1 unnamed protein product [Adineta steineri]